MYSNLILHLHGLHRPFDREIETERRQPRPVAFRLMRLKKLKLGLEDRIHRLKAPTALRPA